jgi:ABC-type maltose transport system permease subunit
VVAGRRRGFLAPLAILFLSFQRFWRIDLISGGIKG